jgi:hypothetical protein
MRPIVAGLFASIMTLTLLPACGSDSKTAAPTTSASSATSDTVPGLTLPGGGSLPSGVSLPSDFTIPQQTIDLMIQQFEAAGMKVDKACFTALLSDESVRKLVEAGSSGTPTPELTQKFFACLQP